MKMIAKKGCFILIAFTFFLPVASISQDLTGIWRGYFISENGEQYKLEFQVTQNNTLAVSGVSYSYLDVRFYGKATMTGSFIKSTKNFRIKEIKTVEVKSLTGGGTCIMNYDLVYAKSGKEEFLEGTYLGKQEVKGSENPYEWGDCGGGTVFLRKVPSSDFYIEPFLRKKTASASGDSSRKDSPPATRPPVVRKTTPTRNPVVKNASPTTKAKNDSVEKKTEITKHPMKESESPTPIRLKERSNELMKALVVHDRDVIVKLYDNGEVDDDSISIYYDNKLLVSNKRLSTIPITVNIRIEDENDDHELVMVAENLGRIPPNTALMLVYAGDQRFDVRITSTEQKNALVRFRYQQPK